MPAARRRERQAAVAAFVAGGGSSGSSSAVAKRPRLGSTQAATASHTSTSLPNTPRSFDATSTHQGLQPLFLKVPFNHLFSRL